MRSHSEPGSPTSPSSLKQKLKSSLCLPCFGHHHNQHHREALNPNNPATSDVHDRLDLVWTPSCTWLKSPEIKGKCRSLISRIGHCGGTRQHHHHHHHNRRHSADFRYDALSYSLNFDEGFDDSRMDEFPLRNFSSRLPPSPSPRREFPAYT